MEGCGSMADVSILPTGSRLDQRTGQPRGCAPRLGAAAHRGAGITAVPLRARGPVDSGAEDLGSHARWGKNRLFNDFNGDMIEEHIHAG